MTGVIAEVKAGTGGKQQPRVDIGLSRPFYFVDPTAAAAQAQAALDKSRAELADLDATLADLQNKIAAASDAQARQRLEVERQRQEALQAAKALEAQNLAAAADKQQTAAQAAAKLAAEREAAQAANLKAQSDLSSLAAARRAELERLATDAASDNPDVLIDTVERLEKVLAEVDGQHTAALYSSLGASGAVFDKQLATIKAQQPEIVETDAEFAQRIAKESAVLEARRQAELESIKRNIEGQRTSQTASMRKQHEDTLKTLQTRVWTLAGSAAKLTIGTFDRNERTWPFTVESTDPAIPMASVSLVAELGKAPDPRAAILALDAAVKAGALAAEIDWGISRTETEGLYAIDIRAVRVRNLGMNEVVAQYKPKQRAAYFSPGGRSAPTPTTGTLSVSVDPEDGPAEVYLDGVKAGVLPNRIRLGEGTYRVEVKWADPYAKTFSASGFIQAGKNAAIAAVKTVYKVGDTGPAGGIVFYDKGDADGGWRYLEAAPMDQSRGIQWYNRKHLDIKTGTAVGTGKANTEAIIAAQGEGGYAAMLCKKLSLGGFSDWFLPSLGELDLMNKNLKKAALGGFGSSWYWSSSQYNDYYSYDAWFYSFLEDFKSNNNKNGDIAVRAVRAF
jgi:hypothetical protein